jgi:HD-GYP domain-containing protein (c-di-GMP phosphodiesterase class II)
MEHKVEPKLWKYFKDVIHGLAVILRSSQIHDTGNVAVVSSINRYVTMVNKLMEDSGYISVELVSEFFYVNGNRVKFPSEYRSSFDFLSKEFAERKLGSVTFNEKVSPADMQLLARAFLNTAGLADPYGALVEAVSDSPRIEIGKARVRKEDEEFDARKTIKKTYFNAVSFTKGVMKKIKSGEKISVKRAKRVVQTMVDQLLEEQDLLLGMTAIKDYDDYTYHHSVNVSILSVALGQQLGFPRKALLDLGLAALFHDIGKLDIPPEILNKPAEFTDEEWLTVRKHPFWGVKEILDIRGFDHNAVMAAIVAFEHHIHHDNTGYPRRKTYPERDLFSKIVSIVDQYDGMTSARVYSRTPMTPDKALETMMTRSGTQLDPVLMKFFINMIGIYPVGSLVLLDTKELGLVYGATDVPSRPRVLVIVNANGQKIEDGIVVDLSGKNQDGRYERSIMRTMDPNKYKINLSEYLL